MAALPGNAFCQVRGFATWKTNSSVPEVTMMVSPALALAFMRAKLLWKSRELTFTSISVEEVPPTINHPT